MAVCIRGVPSARVQRSLLGEIKRGQIQLQGKLDAIASVGRDDNLRLVFARGYLTGRADVQPELSRYAAGDDETIAIILAGSFGQCGGDGLAVASVCP